MQPEIISLRTFIGSKDFSVSKAFYADLGFEEKPISDKMCLFQHGDFKFYLQDAYVDDWLKNTMLFIEVKDVKACYEWLKQLKLDEKYPGVRVVPTKKDYWGEECFVLDPAGALLHFGQFYQNV